MIAGDVAQTQLLRLSGLPGYPADTARAYALVQALAEACRPHGHAARTVDELAKRGRCPTADEITDAAWGSLSGGERKACAQCHGTGWIHAARKSAVAGMPATMYEGAVACPTCRPPVAAPDEAQQTSSRRKRRAPQPATRNMFGGDG